MPVDIKNSLNELNNKILENENTKYVFSNPLILATILTIIIIVFTYIFSSNDEIYYKYFTIFIFLLNFISIMLSFHTVRNESENNKQSKENDIFYSNNENSIDDDKVQIPGLNNSNQSL